MVDLRSTKIETCSLLELKLLYSGLYFISPDDLECLLSNTWIQSHDRELQRQRCYNLQRHEYVA
jgi:hypothetical protein